MSVSARDPTRTPRAYASTQRGSMVTSGRLSVLEQLERSIKQDRPWEKVLPSE
jgi:hypothetical protein